MARQHRTAARALSADATFYIGHGGPAGHADRVWQKEYVETFVDAVKRADWSDREQAQALVIARVKEYLRGDQLQFLMELSVEPVAARLGGVSAAVG